MKVKVLYVDLMAGNPMPGFDPVTGFPLTADFWRIQARALSEVGGEWIVYYTLPKDADLPEVGSEITVTIGD